MKHARMLLGPIVDARGSVPVLSRDRKGVLHGSAAHERGESSQQIGAPGKRTYRVLAAAASNTNFRSAGLALLLFSPLALAAAEGPLGITQIPGKNGGGLGMPMQIALSLTLLTLLPGIIMCITPFLRIITVLHFLRQALGTQSAPSNQVLLGLGLFLSMLIMQPVGKQIYEKAWVPLEQGQVTMGQAMDVGSAPLKSFLLKFAREKDIKLFLEISHSAAPRTPADLDLKVIIPAYILSELKTGFQIGAVLFLPFLVIDLIVASVTLSIGMVQLPPVMLSAPFKILLFVLVDGWNLVIGSLMKSFYV